MTSDSTMDFMDVGFGEKPVAVFIALPDYDSSNWFIATVFINQMYFILAKLATSMPGGKLLPGGPACRSFLSDVEISMRHTDTIGKYTISDRESSQNDH